ncbi:MAG: hypothetical protein HY903_10615 [Deltaproteobacteria bacterium]|nr:hypothetical protein [Deltaproteobacteria bacterium]
MVDEFKDDLGDDEPRASGLSDSLRKAFVSGVSALFMTEEGIRSALSEMRLPKEALTYLAQQTDRTRKELFRAVSAEVKGFLKGVDLSGAVRKALMGLKVQVRAEVRFVDAGGHETKVETEIADAAVDKAPRPRRSGRRSRE